MPIVKMCMSVLDMFLPATGEQAQDSAGARCVVAWPGWAIWSPSGPLAAFSRVL